MLCASLACVVSFALAPLTAPRMVVRDGVEEELRGACARIEGEADERATALGVEALTRVGRNLDDARLALDRGRWATALPPLAQAFREVREAAFAARTAAWAGLELDAFDARWRAERAAFERLAPRNSRAGEAAPALLHAVRDEAHARAWKYYASSGAYATAAGVASGRHYLGRGYADAELVALLDALPFDSGALAGDDFAGLDGVLEALERELSVLYAPPRSRRDHDGFIELSSRLENARSLARGGARAASLQMALDVRRRSALFTAATASATDEELEASIAASYERLDGVQRDTSVATYWLANAEAMLERAAAGDMAARGEAGAILLAVLPDCFAASSVHVAQARPASEAERVTVTLVRWPFT